MKHIHFSRKTIHLALLVLLLGLIVTLLLMIYAYISYTKSFCRVDRPEERFSGNLRYGDVDGYKRTGLEFKSGEHMLKGYVYGKENAKGLVVISHGLGLGSVNYLAETLYFVDKGWCVFVFDNTATHESEGKSTVGPSQSLLDLKAALSFITTTTDLKSLPVFLYGHSWGAYAVTAVLSEDFDISAVTSIAGFNSPMELLQEQAHALLGKASPITHPFLLAHQRLLFGSDIYRTATKGINVTKTPVMIIHGINDEAIAYSGASIIAHKQEITNPNVVYSTYDDEMHSGHNNIFASDEALEYIKLKNLSYRELYDTYEGAIPDRIRVEFYEGIDRFQVSELNLQFMEKINDFFEQQLE